MAQPNRRWVVIASLFALAAVVLAGLILLRNNRAAEQGSSGLVSDVTEYRGTVYEPPQALADFTLPASTGQDLSLSDLRGQWVLMFFGYTHCPDICPTTLAEFRQVKAELGDDATSTTFLFVSVDAPRDTPAVIENFVTRFDPSFIGMSADDETLARMAPEYGLFYERHPPEGDGDNYVVDHSGRSYLVDPQGAIRISYAYGTDSDVIAETIRELMNQS